MLFKYGLCIYTIYSNISIFRGDHSECVSVRVSVWCVWSVCSLLSFCLLKKPRGWSGWIGGWYKSYITSS